MNKNWMLRILTAVVLGLVVSVGIAFAAPADKGAIVCPNPPADAKLEKYPIVWSGHLSVAQATDMGLRSVRLKYDFVGWNFYRDSRVPCGGKWVFEKIPDGTLVWVNEDGYVVYKEDCSNRLVWAGYTLATPTPAPPVVAPPPPAPQVNYWLPWNWNWGWGGAGWPWNWPYLFTYTNYDAIIRVSPNGGTVKVTSGDTTVEATGYGRVDVVGGK